MPELSIIVVNWNTREYTKRCLDSLLENVTGIEYEVVVVDNGSSDGSQEMIKSNYPWVNLIQNSANNGFTMATNQGLRQAKADFMLILNSDIVVLPRAVSKMLEIIRNDKDIGVLAGKLLNPDNTTQRFCRRFPKVITAYFEKTFLQRLLPQNPILKDYYMDDFTYSRFEAVEQPPGCCLMFKREVLEQIGFLDQRMFLFYSDVDWCQRMHIAGRKNYFTPLACFIHYHGISARQLVATEPEAELIWHRDRFVYYRKYYGFMAVAAIKIVMGLDFMARTVELLLLCLGRKAHFSFLLRCLKRWIKITVL